MRWVLGESKASELRGESMQDVIFNGTNLRKPAGRASVELAFDNAEGRAGGPWNRFAEIAVKRVLTRDGTSSYHINGQPVRRRDIQDVFLGTGLGPRAYAIIGQGTISRIIESKPEELRLFLEEAAGVSKYKERRRETETRLKDTRENLTRVDDILRELNGNLEKLESQAEVAGRYRAMQQEAQTKLHQLWFLQAPRRGARARARRPGRGRGDAALESRNADLRRAEAELEAIRQTHYEANDALHAAQGALGQAALEVSRLEERIRYVAAGRERLAAPARRSRGAERGLAIARERSAAPSTSASAARSRRPSSAPKRSPPTSPRTPPRLAASRGRAARSAGAQPRAARRGRDRAAADPGPRRRGARRRRATGRRPKRDASACSAKKRAWPRSSRRELEAARRAAGEADAQHAAALATVADWQARVPALDEERRTLQDAVNDEGRRHAELGARLPALQALQEKVQVENKLKPWLASTASNRSPACGRGSASSPAGRPRSRRRCASASARSRSAGSTPCAPSPPTRRRRGWRSSPRPPPRIRSSHHTLPRLADLLHLGDAGLSALLGDWLEGVYTASDFDAALAARSSLTHGEVIMTREGHAVSQFAVSFYAPDSEQAGLLARAQEIENLRRQTRAQALVSDESRSRLVRAEAASTEAAAHLAASQREAAAAAVARPPAARRAAPPGPARRADAACGASSSAASAPRSRPSSPSWPRGARSSESRFEALDVELGVAQERQAELDEATLAASGALDAARDEQRALERKAQEAQFELRSFAARRQELERAIETARQQLQSNLAADAALADEHAQLTDEPAQAELQSALATRLEHEQRLGEKRSLYDDLSQRLRGADEARLGHEQALQPLRDKVTRAPARGAGGAARRRAVPRAARGGRAPIATRSPRAIEEGGVKLSGLQGKIDALNREIEALGAVNLAALEELGQARERKGFLDAQNADLTEAMATLEDAIRKIDLETRELLGSTFDQVNEHFGRMFPTLFGGGTARLVMTGDEILDAGVQVMAQPPGKKNSSIHLLSGGEKALAAIALVFAIFQLNPAPFCLLDEVDAPLDDANTERYAKLVTEMSKATQFLFISHNRIAMEMAEQLIGVTMQEQGVSRIVTVDMPGAMRLAEAA